jgi:serine/threonine protein kinase
MHAEPNKFTPERSASEPSLRDHALLGGKYRICSRLGGGGQAEVFLALASDLLGSSEPVVLKKLRPETRGQPELLAMFLDEARLAARLNHPNIVHTYEVGAADDYFIAMEFLEGQPLNLVRARSQVAALGPAAWARIVADALAGLHYVHELTDFDGTPLGVVHRDVSPHNIFVTYDGQVKLVDFGVAKAALNRMKTQVGAIKGKASYMSPEQVAGRADRRSDVFAMGIVLWEALAGRKLFTGDLVGILHQVLNDPVPRLSSVLPEVDPRLEAIVARALEKDPAARYPTARAMREALEAYLVEAGEPVRSEDIGRWLRAAFADECEQSRRRVQAARGGEAYDAGDLLPSLPGRGRPRSSSPSLPPPPHVAPPPDARTTSGWQIGGLVHRTMRRACPPRSARARAPFGLFASGVAAAGLAFVMTSTQSNPGPLAPLPAASAPAPAVTTPAPPGASLEVHSDPQGARVSWGDKVLGATPLTLELPPGEYALLLSKEGYRAEPLVIALPGPGSFAHRAVSLQSASAPPAGPRASQSAPAGGARRAPALAPADSGAGALPGPQARRPRG